MLKVIKTTFAVLVLTGASYGVYAACGDSTCKWVGGDYQCLVETREAVRLCTVEHPCNVNCN